MWMRSKGSKWNAVSSGEKKCDAKMLMKPANEAEMSHKKGTSG